MKHHPRPFLSSPRSIAFAALAALCPLSTLSAATILTGDHTIEATQIEDGDLTIAGSLHIESQLDFGTTTETTPQAAVTFLYEETGSLYSTKISAARDNTSFFWQQNAGGTAETKMKLASDNVLSLYDATTGTEKISLNPNTGKITLGTGGGVLLPDGTLISGASNFRSTALYDLNGTPRLTVDANGNLQFAGQATFQQAIKANGGVEFAPGLQLNEDNATYLSQTLQNLGYREPGTPEDYSFMLPDGFTRRGIAQDATGNVYLTGNFSKSGIIGPTYLECSGPGDVFVVKLNSQGVAQWAQKIVGTNNQFAAGIAVDAGGNAYVTGTFTGTINEGIPSPLVASGNAGFIVKYSQNGIVDWAKSFGGPSLSSSAIAVDDGGNAYVTGSFSGTISAGLPQSLVSAGGNDAVVIKFNSVGTAAWARRFGGTGFDGAGNVGADSSGNTYVTGIFSGTIASGLPQPLVSAGDRDVFLVKFNSTGTVDWGKRFGSSTAWDDAPSIAVSSSGNAYVAGTFYGSLTGALSLTSHEDGDVYLAKFNPSGTVEWSRGLGGAAYSVGIAVDGPGNSYVACSFMATSTGLSETLHVAKFDNSGAAMWDQSYDGKYLYDVKISAGATGSLALSGFRDKFWLGSQLVTERHIYLGTDLSLANLPNTPSALAWGSSKAISSGAVALGDKAFASGIGSVALGASSSSGEFGFSAGTSSATGYGSSATGTYSIASGESSTAMGRYTLASGEYSTAMGYSTSASSLYSTAMGRNTSASGESSTAMGYSTSASGESSTAMGYSTSASSLYSTAMGIYTLASGEFSTAMGFGTAASGEGSTAMGDSTSANGENSTAMGYYTSTNGYASTAMGDSTSANGFASTAMGWGSIAAGESSTAMGCYASANGSRSTAMGDVATANGNYSTAMGSQTTTNGESSTAMGELTSANGFTSTAMGYYTSANSPSELATGHWNLPETYVIPDPDYASTWPQEMPLFMIGNGNDEQSRSNAFVVRRSGKTEIAGDLQAAGSNNTLPAQTLTGDDSILTVSLGDARYVQSSGLADYVTAADAATTYRNLSDSYSVTDTNTAITSAIAPYRTIATSYSKTEVDGGFISPTELSSSLSSYLPATTATATYLTQTNAASTYLTIASASSTYIPKTGPLTLGISNTVTGSASHGIGSNLSVVGAHQFVIGRFNEAIGNTTAWQPEDPLFVVANGTDNLNRSNALVVKKNGSVVIPSGDIQVMSGDIEITNGTIRVPQSGDISMGDFN